MTLFKYCNSNGKLILENLEIKVTPPNELNDDREMTPVVEKDDADTWGTEFVAKRINDPEFYRANAHRWPTLKSFAEFQAFAKRIEPTLSAHMAEKSPELDCNLQKAASVIVGETWGFVCLSGDVLQEQMWAYYGASHKGLAVEFDENHKLFTSGNFYHCDYNNEPVIYDPTKTDGADVLETLARRKSTGWKHEDESRLVVRLSDCRKITNGKSVLYLLTLDPKIIVSVTFGLRAAIDLKNGVLRALENPNLQHVNTWQVRRTKRNELERIRI